MRSIEESPHPRRGVFHGWGPALRQATVALASAFVLAAPVAHAADGASEGPVQVKLTQSKVELDSAGKEQLVEVGAVKPGDVIEYRAVYTNTSKAAVRDLTATLPISDGLEYVARTAKGSNGLPAAQVATRDGQSGAEPLMVTQGGKKVEVPASQYRVLRWRVASMPAGGSVTVSARARVSDTLPAAPGVATDAAPKR